MTRRKLPVLLAAAAACAAAVVAAPAALRADVKTNVPEAADFDLVYTFDIPDASPGWNTTAVPYADNNAAAIPDSSFSRIGYYVEVQKSAAGSPLQWVYASFDAAGFTRQANKLGLPTTTSGAFFQQNVANLNVVSNIPGIVTGTGLSTGNVEFWPSNYNATNGAGVPNASATAYDFGDGGAGTSNGHASMQIHNHDVDGAGPGTAGQTLFAYNAWGGARTSEFGVGSQPTGNPDWTFNTANISTYAVKRLQVVVGGDPLPPPPPPPPPGPKYMPLGDSITFGSGGNGGGYRDRLYTLLANADPAHTPDLVGSNTGNPSPNLANAGETNHQGHGGYRIDELTANLDANSARSDDAGGFWLRNGATPTVVPDYILLHIGTNDITQGASNPDIPTIARDRLDALLDKINDVTPTTKVIVASLIVRNDANEGLSNAYNAMIPGLVAEHAGAGEPVYFLDMHGKLTTADLVDAVHPSQAGYNKMADAWFGAIQAVPEPSSAAAVIGACAVGLCARRRGALGRP